MGLPSPSHTLNTPSRAYSYRAFGLTIASSLALPELLPQTGTAEVCVRYGAVPDALEEVQKREASFELNGESFLLKIPGIAKYLVLGGKEIIIQPAPGVSDHEVRLFLLGSVFGALFHQRGLLPLHGCALEIDGGAVIFMGTSGIGKSSLAGALNQKGYRVITDDVSVLAFAPGGRPVVHSSCRHLKLGPEVLRKMGKNPEAYPQVLSDLEKYYVPLGEGFCAPPKPVHRAYELATHDSRDFRVTPLRGIDKLTALITHSYRLDFLAGAARRKSYFEQCGQVAQQISVHRLIRPRWPFPLTGLVDFLEKEWG